MVQYLETKKQYPDCILFFRIGDFYEMFFEDAKTASEELDLVLTGKDCGTDERAPMCGIPYHAADNYIARLVKKGYSVAIGEQVEDPKTAKGIVKRNVVRVITPGTICDAEALDEGRNNYLMCAVFRQGTFGVAAADVSTGEFFVSEVGDVRRLYDEINRFMPSELICNDDFYISGADTELIKSRWNVRFTKVPSGYFDEERCRRLIEEHFHAEASGLGFKDMSAGLTAAGAVLKYIYDTQFSSVDYITSVRQYNTCEYMVIDTATMRNLELLESMRDKSRKGTLLWVLDKTKTAMGSRLMRRIISQPLLSRTAVEERQQAVAELNDRFIDREEIFEYLRPVYDLERLLARFSSGRANPLDAHAFRQSVSMLPHIKRLLTGFEAELMKKISGDIDELSDICNLLENAVDPDASVSVRDGGIIRSGFDEEVDRLRASKTEGRKWLMELEAEEREKTGIKTLKIKYNRNFGYCIEVSNSFKDLTPEYFIRKQTLTTGERYTTERLEELSSDILGADEKLRSLEYDIFCGILRQVSGEAVRIQRTAAAVAYLDVLCSFSYVAMRNKYVRPKINESGRLDITGGRHPVVELMLRDGAFVANDTRLNSHNDRIAIITGPNMAGKSTYMRQVALITLMAQIGSFVPAVSADISICDRIFTRVGASDDLASGQSTFMVEMTEVANILRNATSESLLILDEIGRGTSTYDGLSIAWAVVEYISDRKKLGAKALFATHYHELTELEGKIKGVHNFCISVKEEKEELIFLRKIIPGGADKSYGIAVARLAGVPKTVTDRASDIAEQLAKSDINAGSDAVIAADTGTVDEAKKKADREKKEILDRIVKMDLTSITPMEAFFELNRLQERLRSYD